MRLPSSWRIRARSSPRARHLHSRPRATLIRVPTALIQPLRTSSVGTLFGPIPACASSPLHNSRHRPASVLVADPNPVAKFAAGSPAARLVSFDSLGAASGLRQRPALAGSVEVGCCCPSRGRAAAAAIESCSFPLRREGGVSRALVLMVEIDLLRINQKAVSVTVEADR
jgi:hypothetical protein